MGAQHSDQLYEDAIRSTLTDWGVDRAEETVFINSRRIVDSEGNPERPGTQGLIVFHKDSAFIVFRSTEAKFNDWYTDSKIRLVRYPFGPGEVHRGFLEAFSTVVPGKGESPSQDFEKVEQKLKETQHIWLMGHSLGGALASIASCWLLHRGIKVSGLYTFGTPRIGNDEYRNHMNAKLSTSSR